MSKNKARFFTAEEKEFLTKFLATPKGRPHPQDLVNEFCKKYKRDIRSIYQYVNRVRHNKVAGMQKTVTSPVTTDFTSIKRNEFVIPVTNWELRTQDGQTSLILKFK